MPSLVRAAPDPSRVVVPLPARAEPDALLLSRFAESDPVATAEFVHRFRRRVFGVAMRILGDVNLAEDVAQETFVRAWKKADAFDERRGSVGAWLLTIARHLAIDAVRRRRIVVADPDELLARPDRDPDRGPDELALLNIESERLRLAIDDLPEDQRRALLLSAFYGRTGQEIAESESIPLGTAKTRIRTAMIRLREALTDDATDD
jgi:RNA polymerase sigma factor (sigma-70 family)